MNCEIIRNPNFKQAAWSGGITTELYIFPEYADYGDRDFLWRLSTAEVSEENTTFTLLNGYDRWIMTLKGGIRLEHNGKPASELNPLEAYFFDGGASTGCTGKCSDFNLMLKKGQKGRISATTSKKTTTITAEYSLYYTVSGDTTVYVYENGKNIYKVKLEEHDLLVLKKDASDESPKIKFMGDKLCVAVAEVF